MITLPLLSSYFFNITAAVAGVVNVGVICEWTHGFFCGFHMALPARVRSFQVNTCALQ